MHGVLHSRFHRGTEKKRFLSRVFDIQPFLERLKFFVRRLRSFPKNALSFYLISSAFFLKLANKECYVLEYGFYRIFSYKGGIRRRRIGLFYKSFLLFLVYFGR